MTCVPKEQPSPPTRAVDITTPDAAVATIEVDRDAAPACDEGVDSTASCDALKPPGPSCESFSETVASCKRVQKRLRPAAADRVVRCLLARNKTQELCWLFRRGNPVAFCFTESMRASCTDRKADADCVRLIANLPLQERENLDASELQSTCRSAVAAMREPRPMLECLADPFDYLRTNPTRCYENLDVRP